MKKVFGYLETEGKDTEKLWARIKDLIMKTMCLA